MKTIRSLFVMVGFSFFAAIAAECAFAALGGATSATSLDDLLFGPGYWLGFAMIAAVVGWRMAKALASEAIDRGGILRAAAFGPPAASIVVIALLVLFYLHTGAMRQLTPRPMDLDDLFTVAAMVAIVHAPGYMVGAWVGSRSVSPEIRTPSVGRPDSRPDSVS